MLHIHVRIFVVSYCIVLRRKFTEKHISMNKLMHSWNSSWVAIRYCYATQSVILLQSDLFDPLDLVESGHVTCVPDIRSQQPRHVEKQPFLPAHNLRIAEPYRRPCRTTGRRTREVDAMLAVLLVVAAFGDSHVPDCFTRMRQRTVCRLAWCGVQMYRR